jgi:hypothetical protein
MRPLLLLFTLSSCASLRTGWAKVTWVDGGVVPESACSAHIGAEGDVEMVCISLNKVQRDLLYKSEKRRVVEGEI